MFCNDIKYSRFHIVDKIDLVDKRDGSNLIAYSSNYLGGASAAYVREIRAGSNLSVKITTKIALVCHVVYSIFKGILQGLCSIFLAGKKGEKLALHAKYNLIFTSIKSSNNYSTNLDGEAKLPYMCWGGLFQKNSHHLIMSKNIK